MSRLSLSLACCSYDRTAARLDGRVGVEGCDVVAVALEPEELIDRLLAPAALFAAATASTTKI